MCGSYICSWQQWGATETIMQYIWGHIPSWRGSVGGAAVGSICMWEWSGICAWPVWEEVMYWRVWEVFDGAASLPASSDKNETAYSGLMTTRRIYSHIIWSCSGFLELGHNYRKWQPCNRSIQSNQYVLTHSCDEWHCSKSQVLSLPPVLSPEWQDAVQLQWRLTSTHYLLSTMPLW